ncbi:MAG: hypothetical protein JWM27_1728 [Gemmatimonadetes bacterium]|nr:hypothetical protein [Gemmatimonadota bacterium]
MIEQIRGLMGHLRWADARVLESLEAVGNPPEKALELYAHVLGAEHVWLSRLRGEAPAYPVWPALLASQLAPLAAENADALEALVAGLAEQDVAREVAYANSAGQQFTSTLGDILLQVAMHGSYHRGQVALLLREHGAQPAATDYIVFARGAPAAARRG